MYHPLEPHQQLDTNQIERHKMFLKSWATDEEATDANLIEMAIALEEVATELRQKASEKQN